MILTIALLTVGGLWLGSTFFGFFTRGIPVLGVASIGTIAALGVLLLLGGVALLSAIYGVVAVAFGVATVIGTIIGFTRHMEQRGRRYKTEYARLYGLKLLISEYWKEITVTAIILLGLMSGLNGGVW